MKYSIIPITTQANQTFTTTLDEQICEIKLYWRYGYFYLDLMVQKTVICTGAICITNEWIIQQPKLNFNGNLVFVDKDGHGAQPVPEKLGTRFLLCFVPESELRA